MPQDRLRSPRAGHGRRTSALNDFEYRVWDQYQLSADDFGVMRCSALTIQNDNDALAQRPQDDVQAALERLIAVGLVLVFEHQERRYICQPDWQEFQKVEYPRVTLLPRPSPEVLERLEPSTRRLFAKHPGGTQKKAQRSSKGSPNVSRTVPKESPTTRARVPAKRLTASANGSEANGQQPTASGSSASTVSDRFEQFWAAYPKKKAKDAALAWWNKRKPDEGLLATMLASIERQKRTRDWQEDDGRYIPHPATWLNQGRWQDDAGRGPASAPPPPGCLHRPPCADPAAHTKRYLAEQRP